ncbi:MAG: metallophosphoesterase, partial [Promethearchaeota archaeon]
MAENNSDKTQAWQLIWGILLTTSSIAFIILIYLLYSQFSTTFQGQFAPVVWIAVAFTAAVAGTSFFTTFRIFYKVATKKEIPLKIRGSKKVAWSISWSIWHLLLGIILVGAFAYFAIEYKDEITSQMIPIATALGIMTNGLGSAFIISSLKVFIEQGKKVKTPKIAPGITVIGISFLLLIPAVGLFYYLGVYLPDERLQQPMNRGPFLFWRNDTSSTMVVAWDSVTESSYSIKWGESASNLNNTGTPSSYQIHAPSSGSWESGDPIGYRYYIELTGLKPSTVYYYTIPGFISKTYSFKTGPSGTAPFSFQVIGDTRRPDTQHSKLVNMMINDYDADFVINTGDVCNNAELDWNQFFSEIQPQANERPYLVAVGNHEYGNEFGYYFNYEYTPDHYYYSLNYSNAHFLFIDCFDGSGGFVSSEQKTFIENDLKRNAGKHDWIVVAFHVPIFSTGDFNYDTTRESDFMPLFTQYGVDVVLTGHDHHYESFNISRSILEAKFGTYNSTGNGMMHFVSGGGGSPLDIPQCMNREVDPWKKLYHNSSNPEEKWQKYFPKGATAATANYTVSDI